MDSTANVGSTAWLHRTDKPQREKLSGAMMRQLLLWSGKRVYEAKTGVWRLKNKPTLRYKRNGELRNG
jgi:hypothetical protein